jgi:hypothetical protein
LNVGVGDEMRMERLLDALDLLRQQRDVRFMTRRLQAVGLI